MLQPYEIVAEHLGTRLGEISTAPSLLIKITLLLHKSITYIQRPELRQEDCKSSTQETIVPDCCFNCQRLSCQCAPQQTVAQYLNRNYWKSTSHKSYFLLMTSLNSVCVVHRLDWRIYMR